MPDGVDLDKLDALRAAAQPVSVDIERRDDEDGSIDWILHGKGGDMAACFQTANRNAKQNAAYIAALVNAAPSLIASARDLAELLACLPRCQWIDVVDGPCQALATVGAATPNPARYCDMHSRRDGPRRWLRGPRGGGACRRDG